MSIAVQLPFSGEARLSSEEIHPAVELAVAEANASPGHPGLTFAVFQADDRSEPDQARVAAQAAIDDPDVLAVIGPLRSDMVKVVGPLYGKADLAVVSASATTSSLTTVGFPTLLRALPHDGQVGAAIGEFLLERQISPITVIDDGSSYGVRVADGAHEALFGTAAAVDRRSASLFPVLPYPELAQQVVDEGAKAVAFCGGFLEGTSFPTDLQEAGYAGLRVGEQNIMAELFPVQAGAAGEGWYAVAPYYDTSLSAARRDFAARFEGEYGKAPGRLAPRAYDITRMIIEAVAGLGQRADRASVFEALSRTRYQGITGTISFDSKGEYTGAGPELYQLRDGAYVPLGPAENYAA